MPAECPCGPLPCQSFEGGADIAPSPPVNDTTRAQGAANPDFSYDVQGLVVGETTGVITGFSLITTANQNSSAGSYDIVTSGETAQNYDLSYQNGTLTVTASNTSGETPGETPSENPGGQTPTENRSLSDQDHYTSDPDHYTLI